MDPYTYSPLYVERRRQREGEEIRRVGRVAGGCVIAYVLLENLVSVALLFEPFRTLYETDPAFLAAFVMVESVIGLLLPFLIGGLYLREKNRVEVFAFDRPRSASLTVTVVLLGMLVCTVGDYVTGLLVNAASAAGITLTAPDFEVPADLFGRIAYAVMVAVLPPLVEEFAMRGVVMQPLRRYGDPFAIVASAFVFAVLHGNLVQAPFAFIAGLGLGYAVCVTGSIWTGVLIHALNNGYSVALEFLTADLTDQVQLERVYVILMLAITAVCVVGAAAHVWLCKKQGVRRAQDLSLLPAGAKARKFLLNVPMIIAMLMMLWITKQYVAFQ